MNTLNTFEAGSSIGGEQPADAYTSDTLLIGANLIEPNQSSLFLNFRRTTFISVSFQDCLATKEIDILNSTF